MLCLARHPPLLLARAPKRTHAHASAHQSQTTHPHPSKKQTPPQKSYGSFALISGHPASLAVLGWTVMLNLSSLRGRAAGHAARGGAEYEKYVARTPAVVPWRLFF